MSAIIPFEFESVDVRTVLDDQGEPWFVAKDVALALGYADTTQAVRTHCPSVKSLKDIVKTIRGVPGTPLQRHTKMIPEGDVYKLTLASTLPSAKRFQDWVAYDVIPTIRKTGSYSLQNEEDENWLDARDNGKGARAKFVSTVAAHGASSKTDFAKLTNVVYDEALGMTAAQIRGAVAMVDGIKDARQIAKVKPRDHLQTKDLVRIAVIEDGSANRIEAQDVHGIRNMGKTIRQFNSDFEALMSGKLMQVLP
jgi:prophage antirepressor-like protein